MRATPPGPKGVPVIGNTQRFARDPFSFLSSCRDAYGDVARLSLGGDPAYMLTNPADIERVLVSEERKFRKPMLNDDIRDLLGNGLLLSEGDFWRRERRRTQPAFDMRRIAGLAGMMTDHTEAMLGDWADGEAVTVDTEMARLTVKIIVEAMFGVGFDDATVERMQANLEPLGRHFEPDVLRTLVPDWVPTEENREYHAAIETLEDILEGVLAERRGTERDLPADDGIGGTDGVGGIDANGNQPMDLLSILLRARNDDGDEDVDDALVRDELMTMLLAGHDTTALTLTYTWYLLARNPAIEAELHAELDEVLGGRVPTTADVRDLTYTERVLQEAMRLYPPVHMLFREALTGVRLGGYRVPKGSLLVLPQWAVHRDPRYYDDPLEFDPDRFASDRTAERPNYAYFPFGGGPRHCIGKRFSMLEATLILGTVAQKYRLELAADEPIDLRGSLTMHPTEPIEAIVRER
ncbi:cytochrome P450 [Halobacteriales archaeon QS_8_65_32]|jgi:cytochrome P450|nr:MAG: cytochrome P450 [Halobacteriales archaeon QS_8_65_32]